MSFGNNLRFIRNRQGLTLVDLSKRLEVSVNYLSKLERDDAKMYPHFLPRLMDALDIDDINLLYKELEGNFYSTKWDDNQLVTQFCVFITLALIKQKRQSKGLPHV